MFKSPKLAFPPPAIKQMLPHSEILRNRHSLLWECLGQVIERIDLDHPSFYHLLLVANVGPDSL